MVNTINRLTSLLSIAHFWGTTSSWAKCKVFFVLIRASGKHNVILKAQSCLPLIAPKEDTDYYDCRVRFSSASGMFQWVIGQIIEGHCLLGTAWPLAEILLVSAKAYNLELNKNKIIKNTFDTLTADWDQRSESGDSCRHHRTSRSFWGSRGGAGILPSSFLTCQTSACH